MRNAIEVDEDMEPDPELNRITNAIIGVAIDVHKGLGPGHQEVHYEKAFAVELTLRGIPFQRQVPVELRYKGHVVGEGRLDFLVTGKVVVELKAVEALAPVHRAQVIGYLRMTGHKLAILINFNVAVLKDGIRRIAN